MPSTWRHIVGELQGTNITRLVGVAAPARMPAKSESCFLVALRIFSAPMLSTAVKVTSTKRPARGSSTLKIISGVAVR